MRKEAGMIKKIKKRKKQMRRRKIVYFHYLQIDYLALKKREI